LQALLSAMKILVSIVFLTYSSWSDYRTREVSNRVWLLYGPVALILSLAEFVLYEPSRLPFFGLSFGLTAFIAFVLFYSGGFGGADSKALMCIALALPFIPEITFIPLFASGISPLSQILFPLTVFSNGVLLAAASALYLFFYNIVWHIRNKRKLFEGSLSNESFGKKILVLITGYRTSIAKIEEKWHIYPMEKVVDENEDPPKRNLVIMPKDEGRTEIVSHLSNAVKAGKINDCVWATPGLPLLIFLTVGLILALVFGDIVWLFITHILG
jgi:preflagellin peptidase FlaK